MIDPKRICTGLLIGMTGLLASCNLPFRAAAADAPSPVPVLIPDTGLSSRHELIPVELPADRSSHAGDHNSSTSASQKQAAGGDRFTFAEYERPFNANTMDVYFPALDIVDTLVHQDDLWIYGTITLRGRDQQNRLPGEYGVELDLDVDGKGDWLILAAGPESTDWSAQGVQVWQDSNHDVGGEAASYADENPPYSDGFDRLAFDNGLGDDPDAAFARVSPSDPNTVELAVKRSLLGDTERYLIGMWAGTDLDPAMFDHNDHMTHTQAGAAIRGYEVYYPIKELAEIDATCRMAVGFEPTGSEPGICSVLIRDRSGGGPPPPGGCPPNPNCVWGMNPNCSCVPPPVPR
jgi:hypothetical protein